MILDNEPILPAALINKIETQSYNLYKNRLTAYGTNSYQYDGIGNRLIATRNGVTTKYLYDAAGNLLAEADGSNVIQRYYIHGIGLMAMVDAQTNQLYVYHYDGTGHTVAMADGAREIVNRYAYSPFGELLAKEEQIAQPFTYVGQYGVMTEAGDLYYMRARYYDAEVGRFISEDPIGFAGGLNLYAYVGGNPVLLVDPSGLAVGDWWDLPANFGRAREIAREELLKRPTQHNDAGDAMRHAEWNRRMVEETNTFTAWVSGVGHELDNLTDSGPWKESMMDLHNNAEGRAAGQQGRPVNPANLVITPGPLTPYTSPSTYSGAQGK